MFYSCYHQTQLKTIQHPSYIICRVVIFFGFIFSVLSNFREHIFLARTSISALFQNICFSISNWFTLLLLLLKWIMRGAGLAHWPSGTCIFLFTFDHVFRFRCNNETLVRYQRYLPNPLLKPS